MSNKGDLSLDKLQKELSEAETYLERTLSFKPRNSIQTTTGTFTSDGEEDGLGGPGTSTATGALPAGDSRDPTNAYNSAQPPPPLLLRASLDLQRRTEILQQFGRRPRAAVATSAEAAASSHSAASVSIPTILQSDSVDTEQGRRRTTQHDISPDSIGSSGGKSNNSGDFPQHSSVAGKYADPTERVSLINRLLAQHEHKRSSSNNSSATNTPPSPQQPASLSSSRSSSYSTGSVHDDNDLHDETPGGAPQQQSRYAEDTLFFASDLPEQLRYGYGDSDGGPTETDAGFEPLSFYSTLAGQPSRFSYNNKSSSHGERDNVDELASNHSHGQAAFLDTLRVVHDHGLPRRQQQAETDDNYENGSDFEHDDISLSSLDERGRRGFDSSASRDNSSSSSNNNNDSNKNNNSNNYSGKAASRYYNPALMTRQRIDRTQLHSQIQNQSQNQSQKEHRRLSESAASGYAPRHRSSSVPPPSRPSSSGSTRQQQPLSSEGNNNSNTRRPRSASASGRTLHNRSHSADHSNENSLPNRRYRRTKEELTRAAEQEFHVKYKFQPVLLSSAAATRGDASTAEYSNNNSNSNTHTSGNNDRIEGMLAKYKRQLENRDKRKRQEEELVILQSCPFKPQILPKSEQIARKKLEDESTLMSSSQVWDVSTRLHSDAAKRAEQQQWLKRNVEAARMSQYSFQPAVNPRTGGGQYTEESKKPIYQRVHELQREKSQRMYGLRASLEDAMDETLTFAPQIDKKSRELATVREYRAVLSEQKKQVHRSGGGDNSAAVNVYSYYVGEEREAGADNGSPDLVAQAQAILQMHRSGHGSNVATRLLKEGTKMNNHKQKLLQDRENEYSERFQQPIKLSKGSEQIIRSKEHLQNQSFDERQNFHVMRAKLHQDQIRQEIDKEKETSKWFTPQLVSAASGSGSNGGGGHNTSFSSAALASPETTAVEKESIDERVQRLYQKSVEDSRQRRKAIEQEVYGGYTFTPQIDPHSREIARARLGGSGAHDLDELVNNYHGRHIREEAKRRIEDERGAEYSFAPKITDYYKKHDFGGNSSSTDSAAGTLFRHFGWAEKASCPNDSLRPQDHSGASIRANINLKEPEKMSRDIRLYMNEREERRRAELIAKEIEDLRECSFRPNVDPYGYKHKQSPDQLQQPVIVRGLGRHLELKQMSAKQKEDMLQREKEVFGVRHIDKYRRPEDGSTIIEPFRLAESSTKPSRAVKELLEESEANLTFHPDINANYRKQWIQRHAQSLVSH